MIALELVGVRVELPANQPIVLLKEATGDRYLPIWIGAVEATAIAFALQGVETPRPLTHDLIVDLLDHLDATIEAVHVTDLVEGTFFAELHLGTPDGSVIISCRPSDAIAIASRLDDVPIHCAASVMDEAGLRIEEDDDGKGAHSVSVDTEEEVREFSQWMDNITAEDFKDPS